jgi:phage replication initiation protein
MHTHKQYEDATGGSGAARSAARIDALPPVGVAPCSNTGRKNKTQNPVSPPETIAMLRGGERLEMVTTGKHSIHRLHPLPDESKPASAALIDWLAFTVAPPPEIALMARVEGLQDSGYRWMRGELVRFFGVSSASFELQKSGGSGYKHRATFPGGQILWGGQHQRGTVHVVLSGSGCSYIEDWPMVVTWLSEHRATLTRVDLAYDEFRSETVSFDKLREWYVNGEFGAGGRQPQAQLVDDLGSGKGRTFYVGNRKNGKLFRGYEKGKQLGDPDSQWLRLECEWHHKSRVLPYDMLVRPGQYLAGAFPCLAFLSVIQEKIKTVMRAAKIVYDKAVLNACQQVGKLVNLMLQVCEGDYGEVVDQLRRDGIPKRIEPYSYHVRKAPQALSYPYGMTPMLTE